jgi:predicted ribosome quality control (RQC) complex YloA/Tae2 family protein
MNIDGLTVSALAAELDASLRGSRVQGVFQPQPTLITLELWAGEEKRLLIEIGEQPRVHLTTHKFAHPQRPPAFCMLLRKHLRNGIIVGVSQPGLERMLDLSIRHGEEYTLRTELLGKQTNIVLLRNGTVLGALKSTGGQRSFRPGEVYQAPPAHEKLDPRTMTPEEFFARLSVLSAPSRPNPLAPFPEGKGELPYLTRSHLTLPLSVYGEGTGEVEGQGEVRGAGGEGGGAPLSVSGRGRGRGLPSIAQALLQIVDGIGPRLAQEIALRAQLDPAQPVAALTAEHRAALWSATRQLWESISQHPSPSLYFDDDRPVDISPVPLQLYAHLRRESFPTLSQALDAYVRLAPQVSTFAHERHRLQEIVRGHCAKVRHALERVAQDLERSKDSEQFRREGELLLAHLAELRKGLDKIELEDFLDGTRRTIKLDPALDPVENAQQKFERYKKLKRAQEKLAARVEELRQELEYLESVEHSLEQAESDADLAEIREELSAGGYLPREPQSSKGPAHAGGPREFVIRGYRVWVGRSSKQNDELVRGAAREDYWLHARDRPGSHVIVKNPTQREIPRDVLEQAAQLAAYYSKGRDAKKVPVSYTRVKYLRKGGRPGLVLMTQEEGTLIVAPKGDL